MRDFTVASENLASAAHFGLVNFGHPSYQHLLSVVGLLYETIPGATDELIAAAWLHDTLKYTDTTELDIRRITTNRVAAICQLVTDPGGRITPTSVRAERAVVKAALYANFRAETNPSILRDAAIIRLVDRAANHRTALYQQNEEKIRIFTSEYAEYRRVYVGEHLYGFYPREQIDHLVSILDIQYERMEEIIDLYVTYDMMGKEAE